MQLCPCSRDCAHARAHVRQTDKVSIRQTIFFSPQQRGSFRLGLLALLFSGLRGVGVSDFFGGSGDPRV